MASLNQYLEKHKDEPSLTAEEAKLANTQFLEAAQRAWGVASPAAVLASAFGQLTAQGDLTARSLAEEANRSAREMLENFQAASAIDVTGLAIPSAIDAANKGAWGALEALGGLSAIQAISESFAPDPDGWRPRRNASLVDPSVLASYRYPPAGHISISEEQLDAIREREYERGKRDALARSARPEASPASPQAPERLSPGPDRIEIDYEAIRADHWQLVKEHDEEGLRKPNRQEVCDRYAANNNLPYFDKETLNRRIREWKRANKPWPGLPPKDD